MTRFYIIILVLLSVSFSIDAQNAKAPRSTQMLLDAFTKASLTYNVPSALLKAVAYEQTRFSSNTDVDLQRGQDQQPPLYGIMGLRNDNWFGHSLLEGAALINQPADVVALNPSLNIQAAAALLSSIADSLNIDRSNLNNWRPVLEEFSGIPQKNIRPFFTFDVFKVLSDGTDLNGISIPRYSEINMNQFSPEVNPKSKMRSVQSVQDQSDYPPAFWSPSQNFYNDNNFNQLFLVVHDTEGPFASSLSWLQNPASSASAHYIIRSSDGYIVQMVHEKFAAWHVACWNRYMLGVEHEGYVNNPAYFTEAMYKASAGLYRHMIETWGIPLDRNHVIGHWQWEFPDWVQYMQQNYPYINTSCNNHTDPGKYWDWNHYFSLIKADATIPTAVSFFPASSTDSVWANTPIKITFSIAMSDTSLNDGFSISPAVPGTFSLEDHAHTVVFTPSELLSPKTKYTVTVNQFTTSILGASLDSTYSFSFVTKSFVPLKVVSSYPLNNQNNISTSVLVLVKFNTPLVRSSLGGKISLQDSTGKTLSIKNATYFQEGDQGVISFMPSVNLDENTEYSVIIKSGLLSINSDALDSSYTVTFRTGKSDFVKGTVIDNFESAGNWKNPSYSGSTVGVDTAQSKFDIVYGTSEDGTHSGRITYVFTGTTGGVCRTYDASKPDIGSKLTDNFGMWVFGDASNNYLEYWFYINGTQNVPVRVDTLNWTGWKFVEIPMSEVGGSGDILFHSVVVVQNPAGADSGAVYIDGAQYRDPSVTSVAQEGSASIPADFRLDQNYPNPFNPSTVIQYQIPKAGYVTLKVYDMLGREVASLVDNYEAAGNYKVTLNAQSLKLNLTSGVYFYTLRSGAFTQTKKLILMK